MSEISGERFAELTARIRNEYTDEFDHIVQKDRDGGDSLNRLACILFCLYILKKHIPVANHANWVANAIALNEEGGPGPGRYCRNPKPGSWWSNYNNTTRDQMVSLLAAFAGI